jgi:hypothetical protein
MAMRLAFDQGLHLDVTPYVEKGIITAEECKIRRTVFWGTSLNDQYGISTYCYQAFPPN